jgi:DMSO/TMAO reductase YedYZ molybdopterin-dependent catalytic subunit
MSSRRQFVKVASAAALATSFSCPLLSSVHAWAAEESSIAIPGKDGLIVRSARFLDLETPVEFMTDWITPVNHFFVRNHMFEPAKFDAKTWQLSINGEVEKPLTLTLADLEKGSRRTVVNTMECAGNGRSLQNPKVPGIQWGKGAVGNARFSGPSLKTLLEKAGVKDTAKHVQFRGLDVVPGKVPPFIRSIPIEKAMDVNTLVATQMNDAALTAHHGFPARAVTPGWAGAASCKWLTEITVLDKPAEGNFMSPGYRLPNAPVKPGEAVKPEDTHSLTSLTVKSLIAAPSDSAKLKTGVHVIRGVAWAAKGGDYTILARASDSQGRVQPDAPVWNPSGYLYNAYDQVKVNVNVSVNVNDSVQG